MKILYVYGDDFAAVSFENARDDGRVDPKQLWNDSFAAGGTLNHDDDDEEEFFDYKALQFGVVDPEFIKWIGENQDYDASKAADFYVIED